MTALVSSPAFVLSLIFSAFLLAGFGVIGLLDRREGLRRLQSIGRTGTDAPAAGESENTLMYEDDRSPALKFLEPLQKKLAQSDPAQVSAARQRLVEAGYYRASAVETYFTMRVILGLALPVAAVFYVQFFRAGDAMTLKLFWILLAAAAGYYLPTLYISSRISDRRTKFKLGMPDALDMMLVGVEAGLSLSASIKHVVKEFASVHPVVAEQFQIVTLEFQAGRSRSEALTGLAKRMNIPVTRTLASMITQSEQLGTSLAQTLQVMAQELRNQRMLEAEKKASELPVKMAFPLVLFIFPALMAVALVPAILSILAFFSEM